jgi:hypothetical protein
VQFVDHSVEVCTVQLLTDPWALNLNTTNDEASCNYFSQILLLKLIYVSATSDFHEVTFKGIFIPTFCVYVCAFLFVSVN